jgi:hypothetical protein
VWVAPGKQELTAIADLIRESSLDWTVVRFLSLTDEPSAPAVKAEVGKVTSNRKIPRSSICAFMVDQVESREFIGKSRSSAPKSEAMPPSVMVVPKACAASRQARPPRHAGHRGIRPPAALDG